MTEARVLHAAGSEGFEARVSSGPPASGSPDEALPGAATRSPHGAPRALVVGSGFGGSVAACRLAQAGFDVRIVERGRRYEAGDFPALPSGALLPDLRRWVWDHEQGLWDVVDLGGLISLQAAGYGGGSLIYANVHLRPPHAVFDDDWPQVYRGGQLLQPYFDLAAYMLEVRPAHAEPSYLRNVVKADQLRRAAHHLGRDAEFFYPPLAISYTERVNRHGVAQRACVQCGGCSTGCPVGAKHSLDHNYLALAERHGARVLTQCEVLELEEIDVGWRILCHDHIGGRHVEHEAEHLFLCAGSIHSTRLLARARLRDRGRQTQQQVGLGYYPGADAFGVVYDTDHPQHPSCGPTITASLIHRDAADPASFFLIQDGGYAPELERAIGLLRAPAWLGQNRLSRREAHRSPVLAASPSPSLGADPPRAEFVLGSVVDDVVQAWAGREFGKVVPAPVRAAFSAWLDELDQPLLLSSIVDQTVDRAARAFYARRWPTRHWDPEGPVLAKLIRIQKRAVRFFFGDGQQIARQALRALIESGGLSVDEIARRVLGYDDQRAQHRTLLLGMGRDAARARLRYDRRRDRLWAELDLARLAPGYSREERLMTDVARALGGELRTNPVWSFLKKPLTVHNQGGCRMSDDPKEGVVDANGKVHGCDGLYVLDGAVLPTSVGVNPTACILALAERNMEVFLRSHPHSAWSEASPRPEARQYYRDRAAATAWVRAHSGWSFSPPGVGERIDCRSQPIGLRFSEWMHGYYSPPGGAGGRPRRVADYRTAEERGRPGGSAAHDPIGFPIELALDISAPDLSVFYASAQHELSVAGQVSMRLPNRDCVQAYAAIGHLQLFVGRHAEAAQRKRFLRYELTLQSAPHEYWLLRGRKRIQEGAGFTAWRGVSSLLLRLLGPYPERPDVRDPGRYRALAGVGVAHLDLDTFLNRQLPSFEVTHTHDPAQISWAILQFATFFFGELQRISAPGMFDALALLRGRVNQQRSEQPS